MTQFVLKVKKTNKVMDKPITAGDMLIQNKDTDDRRMYIAAEVLGEIKLVNVNSGQTFNKVGYVDETRQDVFDIVAEHFNKHTWTFVPAESIKSKDLTLTVLTD